MTLEAHTLRAALRGLPFSEQLNTLLAAAASPEFTSEFLYDMDDEAASERGGTPHEEDVHDGMSSCFTCGDLDADEGGMDLFWHPTSAANFMAFHVYQPRPAGDQS